MKHPIDGTGRVYRPPRGAAMYARTLALVAIVAGASACKIERQGVSRRSQAEDACPPPEHTFLFRLMTKSYIGPLKIGGLGPNPGALPMQKAAFLALAKATDISYGENPTRDGVKNGNVDHFRIGGSVDIEITCRGDEIKSFTTRNLYQYSGGQEIGPIYGLTDAPQFDATLIKKGGNVMFPVDQDRVAIDFVISGRPNIGAEPAFQAIFPRLRTRIWNHVQGRIFCHKEGIAFWQLDGFSGSKFPSHKAWLELVTSDVLSNGKNAWYGKIPQGPFSGLWSLEAVPVVQ